MDTSTLTDRGRDDRGRGAQRERWAAITRQSYGRRRPSRLFELQSRLGTLPFLLVRRLWALGWSKVLEQGRIGHTL